MAASTASETDKNLLKPIFLQSASVTPWVTIQTSTLCLTRATANAAAAESNAAAAAKIKVDEEQDNKLFEIIQTGEVDYLKRFEYGNCNFDITDENGNTPLHLAIKFGDTTFLKHAFKLGAGIDKTNKYGHTLLEFACLEKDPNMINYLTYCGANMKKHLEFREAKKYFNNGNQMDILLLEKKVMDNNKLSDKIKHLEFVFDYINKEDFLELEYCDPSNSTISISKISFDNFIKKFKTTPKI